MRASEGDVGITEFANSAKGFRGILRQRWADFIVNEVALDGTVVHLTTLNPPGAPPAAPPPDAEVAQAPPPEAAAAPEPEVPPEEARAAALAEFAAVAGEADAQKLAEYAKVVDAAGSAKVEPLVLSPESDKAKRTAVHQFFKSEPRLPPLATDTVEAAPGTGAPGNARCVRVLPARQARDGGGGGGGGGKGGRGGGGKKRGRAEAFDNRGEKETWDNGDYVRFALYKENKDTQDALGVIGRMLRCNQKAFGFAGTKDKRGVTCQHVTMYRQRPGRLAQLNARLHGIRLGDFGWAKEELRLGDLNGNRFSIVLRDVSVPGAASREESEAAIKEASEALGRSGFINYFGLQRFGSGSIGTHMVGAALLRGEWEAAGGLILGPREGEREDCAAARKYFRDSKDAKGALNMTPHYMVAERGLLEGLQKHGGNWLNAFGHVPRPLRMMYVHAYQSLMWNTAASHRVATFGSDRAVAGDLVLCEEGEEGHEADGDVGGGGAEGGFGGKAVKRVRYVTEDEAASGAVCMRRVVLPLPGRKVIYPKHATKDVFREVADRDGVSLASAPHSVKEYSINFLTGDYRHVLCVPEDFSYGLSRYTDPDKHLGITDLEVLEANLKGQEPEKVGEGGEGPLLALHIKMTLSTSSYATMIIRELFKESTSVTLHKARTLENAESAAEATAAE